jgi:hypothetical protein
VEFALRRDEAQFRRVGLVRIGRLDHQPTRQEVEQHMPGDFVMDRLRCSPPQFSIQSLVNLQLFEERFRLPFITPPKTKAISGSGKAPLPRLKPVESPVCYFFFRIFGVVNSAGIGRSRLVR